MTFSRLFSSVCKKGETTCSVKCSIRITVGDTHTHTHYFNLMPQLGATFWIISNSPVSFHTRCCQPHVCLSLMLYVGGACNKREFHKDNISFLSHYRFWRAWDMTCYPDPEAQGHISVKESSEIWSSHFRKTWPICVCVCVCESLYHSLSCKTPVQSFRLMKAHSILLPHAATLLRNDVIENSKQRPTFCS